MRCFASSTRARKRGECLAAMCGLRWPRRTARRSCRLDVTIEDVLQHLLPARDVLLRVALLEHVLLEVLERRLALLDPRADAAVPAGVALLDEVLQDAVGADPGGDLQTAGEGVHAADVGVEQIDR